MLKKRAFWPSFFILPALFFALLISSIEGFVFWWVGITCLGLILIIGLPRYLNWTPLSIAVVLYITFLFINVFILSPAFTAKGLYFVCYFTAGFFVFSCLTKEQIEQVFKLAVIVFIFLSIWAIFQYITGQGYLASAWPRVNTIFYTPNTFAAAINLILLPLICIYFFGKNKKTVFGIVLLLFAVLLLTRSRGGQLSFLFGLVAISMARYVSVKYQTDNNLWLRLVSGFAVIFLAISLLQSNKLSSILENIVSGSILEGTGIFQEMIYITRLDGEIKSGTERLVIYDIAWQRIKEKPLLGHGYNHFQYYQLSDQPLSRKGIKTKFVHNDYLQIWMETGLVGLTLLLSIIILFYVSLWKYIKSSETQNQVYTASLLSGMTAYFAHAMVDFVMYPPVLLLMFGTYLGIANALISFSKPHGKYFDLHWLKEKGLRPSILRGMTGIFFIFWLSQPAIAQLAFDQARRDVSKLDIESALKYFELARRFAPYDPGYYSAEGDIWYHAATTTKETEPAQRADKLLAEGAKVNPHEVGNLFLRALLHRDVPELLQEPVAMETVKSWLEYVLYWHPHDNRVQMEYVNTLYRMGETKMVKRLLNEYYDRYPDSVLIRRTMNYYNNLLE